MGDRNNVGNSTEVPGGNMFLSPAVNYNNGENTLSQNISSTLSQSMNKLGIALYNNKTGFDNYKALIMQNINNINGIIAQLNEAINALMARGGNQAEVRELQNIINIVNEKLNTWFVENPPGSGIYKLADSEINNQDEIVQGLGQIVNQLNMALQTANRVEQRAGGRRRRGRRTKKTKRSRTRSRSSSRSRRIARTRSSSSRSRGRSRKGGFIPNKYPAPQYKKIKGKPNKSSKNSKTNSNKSSSSNSITSTTSSK